MTTKTKRIVSTVIGAVPGAGLLMSGIMKLTANPEMVKGLTAGGFGLTLPFSERWNWYSSFFSLFPRPRTSVSFLYAHTWVEQWRLK